MEKCPDCGGQGFVNALGCGKAGPVALAIDCELCEKTGSIDEAKARWHEEGRKLKMDRIERGFVLRAEAKRRGLGIMTLSKMERGLIEPVKG